MTTYAVQAHTLSHAYDGRPVLHQVSFGVRRGAFFIVIGPNGSGKTTLMRLLSGLIRPAGGGVMIEGRPITAYSRRELARRVAFVPQRMPADFPFRVRDVVMFGRTPHMGALGLAGREDREMAGRAMGFTEVAHLADRRLNQLSGGECQRVFIARAVCQDADIIILDEPTASLDIAHQLRIMDMMERMRREKSVTVIMVSHDINLAAMYADCLLLLKSGDIVRQGPPEAVLTYETLEAAYGCALLVDRSPLGDFPRVTPVPGRYLEKGRGHTDGPGSIKNR